MTPLQQEKNTTAKKVKAVEIVFFFIHFIHNIEIDLHDL